MLTVKQVQNAKGPKYYSDGHGLYLRVTKSNTKSWIYRWRDRLTGKLRDMGLGSVHDYSLAEARSAAGSNRKEVLAGNDPILERQKQQAEAQTAASKMLTFDQAAERYIAARVEPVSKNPKHLLQWHNTLKTYVSPVMGSLPVDAVSDGHILAVLEPIWYEKNETASRIRGRIESILGWAKVLKLRTGDNPARWKGHLDTLLPAPQTVQNVQHLRSLPYSSMYGFMQKLQKRHGMGARALEFIILTATRSGEVRGAKWEEIDLDTNVWTIPGERMKAGKKHRVPLSKPAVKLLKSLPEDGEHIFKAPKGGQLSDMTMTKVLRDMKVDAVPHGFRSTFRTWAAETTNFPHEVCEQALAHTIKSKVEAAYQHSDMLQKRATLMEAWGTFTETKLDGKVTQLKPKKTA